MPHLIRLVGICSFCVGTPAAAQVDVGNTFKDYTPIRIPQSEVLVGARWIPGTGPSGDAADPKNIRVSKGAVTSVVTSALKRDVGLNLGSFLGLTADKTKNMKVDLGNIEIHRVRDLSAVNANAGEQIILSAIKAGTIVLSGDSDSTAQLKAAAQAKGIPITAHVAGDKKETLHLNGSGLFLAFQVVAFQISDKIRQRTFNHKGETFTVDKSIQFEFCKCGPDDAIKIYVRNLTAPTAGGMFQTQVIDSKDSPNFWIHSSLKAYVNGNELNVASAKIAYNMQCWATRIEPDGKKSCFADYPKSTNYVQLTTTKFKIVPVKKPIGSF